ncbi:MAG: hypothetical protein JSV04_01235 [Candidatus Heimdallarchaeota archaeon]|nr:MAG: hypothetical protein JSV04_01235 [Candidatus Heimdallarchaeota archaeon]
MLSQEPISHTIIQNFRVRNFTEENIEQEELSCLVQFLSSLELCKTCVTNEMPKIESAFGSDLNYSIDFENRTLDIHYSKKVVSGW